MYFAIIWIIEQCAVAVVLWCYAELLIYAVPGSASFPKSVLRKSWLCRRQGQSICSAWRPLLHGGCWVTWPLGTGPLSIDVTGLRSALGRGGCCCCCCWPGHLWSPAPTFGCIIGTTTHQEANIWLKHFAVFGLQNIANYSLNWKAARSGHWEVSCLLGS